jgi:transposase
MRFCSKPDSPAASDADRAFDLVLRLTERVEALVAETRELTGRVHRLEAENLALREENAALRAENAALRQDNAKLREKLDLPPKTPDNSSTPPSKGEKPSEAESRKPKGKPHAGAHRPLHPKPTQSREFRAAQCPHCRSDVSGVEQVALETYDHIEIPEIVPQVTRVTLLGGRCPCCAGRFKAPPPADMMPGSPFGPNLRALALYLRFGQAIPFARLAQLMGDLFGLTISEGALANLMQAAAPAFASQTSLIKARLLEGTILQSDETSARVGKQTYWVWVFHHQDSACFVIEPHRNKQVVEDFLGEYRPQYWVSDRYGAQLDWATRDHQFCLAHLIREARFAIEAGDAVFAPGLRGLLQEACAIGRRREQLKDTTLKTYAAKLEHRLDELMHLTPGSREGCKLQKVIRKVRSHLFVFVTNRALPATNNGSERALRMCVVFRKVTNCFRSAWGAALYADIRSVIETARRRGIDALQAIRLTLQQRPLAVSPSINREIAA